MKARVKSCVGYGRRGLGLERGRLRVKREAIWVADEQEEGSAGARHGHRKERRRRRRCPLWVGGFLLSQSKPKDAGGGRKQSRL
jgi:hypothetical protein